MIWYTCPIISFYCTISFKNMIILFQRDFRKYWRNHIRFFCCFLKSCHSINDFPKIIHKAIYNTLNEHLSIDYIKRIKISSDMLYHQERTWARPSADARTTKRTVPGVYTAGTSRRVGVPPASTRTRPRAPCCPRGPVSVSPRALYTYSIKEKTKNTTQNQDQSVKQGVIWNDLTQEAIILNQWKYKSVYK